MLRRQQDVQRGIKRGDSGKASGQHVVRPPAHKHEVQQSATRSGQAARFERGGATTVESHEPTGGKGFTRGGGGHYERGGRRQDQSDEREAVVNDGLWQRGGQGQPAPCQHSPPVQQRRPSTPQPSLPSQASPQTSGLFLRGGGADQVSPAEKGTQQCSDKTSKRAVFTRGVAEAADSFTGTGGILSRGQHVVKRGGHGGRGGRGGGLVRGSGPEQEQSSDDKARYAGGKDGFEWWKVHVADGPVTWKAMSDMPTIAFPQAAPAAVLEFRHILLDIRMNGQQSTVSASVATAIISKVAKVAEVAAETVERSGCVAGGRPNPLVTPSDAGATPKHPYTLCMALPTSCGLHKIPMLRSCGTLTEGAGAQWIRRKDAEEDGADVHGDDVARQQPIGSGYVEAVLSLVQLVGVAAETICGVFGHIGKVDELDIDLGGGLGGQSGGGGHGSGSSKTLELDVGVIMPFIRGTFRVVSLVSWDVRPSDIMAVKQALSAIALLVFHMASSGSGAGSGSRGGDAARRQGGSATSAGSPGGASALLSDLISKCIGIISSGKFSGNYSIVRGALCIIGAGCHKARTVCALGEHARVAKTVLPILLQHLQTGTAKLIDGHDRSMRRTVSSITRSLQYAVESLPPKSQQVVTAMQIVPALMKLASYSLLLTTSNLPVGLSGREPQRVTLMRAREAMEREAGRQKAENTRRVRLAAVAGRKERERLREGLYGSSDAVDKVKKRVKTKRRSVKRHEGDREGADVEDSEESEVDDDDAPAKGAAIVIDGRGGDVELGRPMPPLVGARSAYRSARRTSSSGGGFSSRKPLGWQQLVSDTEGDGNLSSSASDVALGWWSPAARRSGTGPGGGAPGVGSAANSDVGSMSGSETLHRSAGASAEVRLRALGLLTALVRSSVAHPAKPMNNHFKDILPIVAMPLVRQNSIEQTNLLTLADQDPSSHVRAGALACVAAILDGEKRYFSVASEVRMKHGSLSSFLFQVVLALHVRLLSVLRVESSTHVTIECLRALAGLVACAPYDKLSLPMDVWVVTRVAALALSPSVSVTGIRLQALTVLSDLYGKSCRLKGAACGMVAPFTSTFESERVIGEQGASLTVSSSSEPASPLVRDYEGVVEMVRDIIPFHVSKGEMEDACPLGPALWKVVSSGCAFVIAFLKHGDALSYDVVFPIIEDVVQTYVVRKQDVDSTVSLPVSDVLKTYMQVCTGAVNAMRVMCTHYCDEVAEMWPSVQRWLIKIVGAMTQGGGGPVASCGGVWAPVWALAGDQNASGGVRQRVYVTQGRKDLVKLVEKDVEELLGCVGKFVEAFVRADAVRTQEMVAEQGRKMKGSDACGHEARVVTMLKPGIERWNALLANILLPCMGVQRVPLGVRSAFISCFASIPGAFVASLKTGFDPVFPILVLTASEQDVTDDGALLRTNAVRALGVLISLPEVFMSFHYVADYAIDVLRRVFPAKARDEPPGVKSGGQGKFRVATGDNSLAESLILRAMWTVANLADALDCRGRALAAKHAVSVVLGAVNGYDHDAGSTGHRENESGHVGEGEVDGLRKRVIASADCLSLWVDWAWQADTYEVLARIDAQELVALLRGVVAHVRTVPSARLLTSAVRAVGHLLRFLPASVLLKPIATRGAEDASVPDSWPSDCPEAMWNERGIDRDPGVQPPQENLMEALFTIVGGQVRSTVPKLRWNAYVALSHAMSRSEGWVRQCGMKRAVYAAEAIVASMLDGTTNIKAHSYGCETISRLIAGLTVCDGTLAIPVKFVPVDEGACAHLVEVCTPAVVRVLDYFAKRKLGGGIDVTTLETCQRRVWISMLHLFALCPSVAITAVCEAMGGSGNEQDAVCELQALGASLRDFVQHLDAVIRSELHQPTSTAINRTQCHDIMRQILVGRHYSVLLRERERLLFGALFPSAVDVLPLLRLLSGGVRLLSNREEALRPLFDNVMEGSDDPLDGTLVKNALEENFFGYRESCVHDEPMSAGASDTQGEHGGLTWRSYGGGGQSIALQDGAPGDTSDVPSPAVLSPRTARVENTEETQCSHSPLLHCNVQLPANLHRLWTAEVPLRGLPAVLTAETLLLGSTSRAVLGALFPTADVLQHCVHYCAAQAFATHLEASGGQSGVGDVFHELGEVG